MFIESRKVENENWIRVQQFDWSLGMRNMENWSRDDRFTLAEAQRCGTTLFLAADCIYDDSLTERLFQAAASLMTESDWLVISLDKRYNFEVSCLDLVAHGYQLFSSIVSGEIFCNEKVFIGEKIDLGTENIPALFEGYERDSSLELWKIKMVEVNKSCHG